MPFQRSSAQSLPQWYITVPIMEYTTESTTDFTAIMLDSTPLASVMLIPILTLKWFTPLLSADTHIPTLLLSVMFTKREFMVLLTQPCQPTPMESTLPIQVLTILDILVTVFSGVMLNPKPILNGYTAMDILHMLDTPDTLASTDTPLLSTTAMSGTELNTCGKYGQNLTICLPETYNNR